MQPTFNAVYFQPVDLPPAHLATQEQAELAADAKASEMRLFDALYTFSMNGLTAVYSAITLALDGGNGCLLKRHSESLFRLFLAIEGSRLFIEARANAAKEELEALSDLIDEKMPPV